ncbi:MAG TPA: ribokinase [Atribacteraceae bacterium]|nr:ribokinase [Atribacteraceae bacterium]
MPKPKMLVVGSLNIDMVLKIDRMPEVGENLFALDFSMLPGGKGNNQAIACSRLGGIVNVIGKIGDDEFGARLLLNLEQENIQYHFVTKQPLTHTGLAFIFINRNGEPRLLVAPGANMYLTTEDLDNASQLFKACDTLLIQLEVPHSVVRKSIEMAHALKIPVILNPAPAQSFPLELLNRNDIISPNLYEAEVLTQTKIFSVDDSVKAMMILEERCLSRKVITLGEMGAIATYDANRLMYLLPREIEVQDTTAAGDAFNAGIAYGLSTGMSWLETLQMANNAAALACTRVGAQSALPYFRDTVRFSENYGKGEVRFIDV